MKRILVVLCLLLNSNGVCADDTSGVQLLQAVSRRLTVGDGLQGTFRQEKHLAFLKQPFVSSGEFTLQRSTGLRWQVNKPLESLMLVQGSGVTLDGKSVKDHGIGQLMAIIMLGIMEGKLPGITQYFTVTGQSTEAVWYLSLQPTSSRLQAALDHIELRGDDYLRELMVFERGDNHTVIQFTSVSPLPVGDPGAVVAAP